MSRNLLLCAAIGLGAGYVIGTTTAPRRPLPAPPATPALSTPPAPQVQETATQPVSRGRVVSATVTAYCPCSRCCGASADGVTSRGRDAYATRGVAVAPTLIPYGSTVAIPGAGEFVADDTGGAMRRAAHQGRYHIDLRFSTHQAALNWGVQQLEVRIVEP